MAGLNVKSKMIRLLEDNMETMSIFIIMGGTEETDKMEALERQK